MTLKVYRSEGVVAVTFERGVTYAEWKEILDGVFMDPLFVRGSGILLDRRTAPVPETKAMWEVARYIDQKESTGETQGWAMVVSDLGSYGMGRMAQELSIHTNSIGVFRGLPEAREWLRQRFGQEAIARKFDRFSVA